MSQHNPVYIPRNHMLEQALDEASKGNMGLYLQMLSIAKQPYQYQNNMDRFMEPSDENFERAYQTFCGT